MQAPSNIYAFGDAWYEKAGSIFMDVARSGVGLFNKARGDSANMVVPGGTPINYANMAVYGSLAALALIIAIKPSGKGKRK